jgi:hypothetical protein
MSVKRACGAIPRLSILCGMLLLVAACARAPLEEIPSISTVELDPSRVQFAIREVEKLQSQGQRVWCVPFARNASGIDIRGNAETWWSKAKGLYSRGTEPAVGAVMAFAKTGKNPMGHVAVVSEVVSDREIKVDHANWTRNEVSLKMKVVDVSNAGDWSAVRLESTPNALGSTYPINGFIYPQ